MKSIAILLLILLVSCNETNITELNLPIPPHVQVIKTDKPILIDGIANEVEWENAEWSSLFQDIEGDKKPMPYYDTRIKMLWDKEYFYVFAEMEEEHIWGDITKRDAVIFYNNDFEVFIKPNQLKSYYTEFEVNALGTLWDLILLKPYRIGGPVSDLWDVNDTKIGIEIYGTLNNPTDIDNQWTVEMAIPIHALDELNRGNSFKAGSIWRVNFSRVQWQHDIIDGKYSRKKDIDTEKFLRENNWVYTPQYAIDMHRPEHWAYMEFVEDSELQKSIDPFAVEQQLLFHLYRLQLNYLREHKKYQESIEFFDGPKFKVNGVDLTASINLTHSGFELIVFNNKKGSISINENETIKISSHE